jgi:hypothetical protein
MVRFRGRVFKSAEERRAYLRDLDKRRNWIVFKIDGTKTAFTELEEFAAAAFPFSMKRQEALVAIVKTFVAAKKPLYLRDLIQRLHREVKVSNDTVNAVWKAMLRAKAITRTHRGEPASLSPAFGSRLIEAGEYWHNYLESHGVLRKKH